MSEPVQALHSVYRVWVVMRDADDKPTSVHLDGSEARVKLIYTEEETKRNHHLQRAHLFIEKQMGHDEDSYSMPSDGSTGG